jgi:hypothetical protein
VGKFNIILMGMSAGLQNCNTGIFVSGKLCNRKKIPGCIMKTLRVTWYPDVHLTETVVHVSKSS